MHLPRYAGRNREGHAFVFATGTENGLRLGVGDLWAVAAWVAGPAVGLVMAIGGLDPGMNLTP